MFHLYLILLLALLNSTLLNAANYNANILTIYSKMLPRFVVMSSQKEKIKNDIEICILYSKLDERVAKSLSNEIKENYPQGLKNYPIKLLLSNYENLESCKNAQLAFMLNSDEKETEETLLFLKKNNILTMSYDISLLEKGADSSLFIGRKVVPYINMKSITDKKIVFDNLLLRVSKIYIGVEK